MPAKRIDFKYVREHADFSKVLGGYGVALERDGTRPGQYKGLCPFHNDTRPSLKVNLERNIFNCFACEEHGNVLDFIMKMDGVDIRTAAKTVANLSGIAYTDGGQRPAEATVVVSKRSSSSPDASAAEAEEAVEEPVQNPVLTFALKNLITNHPFIAERGLTAEMIKTFGLGIARRGIMKDRLVFPIHNAAGELVAYCGRWVAGEPPEDEPKYKQPPQFRKELELFNWHRVKDRNEDDPVVLVESFLSVVKLHERYRVTSPMGRSVSNAQIGLLKSGGVRSVVLLFDGDDPGRAAITAVGRGLLGHGVAVTAPVVAEDFKPHRASDDELTAILAQFV